MNKITIEEIKENIEFIKEEDILEEVTGGYSEAYKYKIRKPDKQYFLKILKNRENAIERIHEILEVYKKSGIDTVHLVNCGVLKKQDMYYCIYDWIDGNCLSSLIDEKDTDYFYKIGKKLGQKLKILKQLKKEAKYVNKTKDLPNRVQEWLNFLENTPEEIVYRYFNRLEMQDIKEKLVDYIKYFNEEDKCFVHMDIKLGNIMIANEKIYLIDIEDMEYNYDVFNILCWPIGVFDNTRKAECDKFFQKGLFEGFDLQREHFDKQILFMYMAKFCFSAYNKYIRKQNLDQLILYKKAYDKTSQFTKLNKGI